MPNDDYIKRSDALEHFGNYLSGCSIQKDDVIRGIEELPAADVEPKRYAEWISPDGISVCSECGKAAPYDVEGDVIMYWPNLNFCPNCGRRMNVEGKYVEIH